MIVNPQQLLDDGFIILERVIPPGLLDSLRTSYEILVERQGGQSWLDKGRQPRLTINHLVDETTADTIEFWLHENTLGVSRQLMRGPEAAVTEMFMMCSPLRQHGPADWHRDFDPSGMAPLEGLQMDVLENGPAYLQWNISLYDDSVLWLVPKSFRRPNTKTENHQLRENPHVPLPGSIPVELKAGDGVVYINLTLHWGSNYGTTLRRTLHGGYRSIGGPLYPYNASSCNWDLNMDFTQYLSPAAQATFEGWAALLVQERYLVESLFQTILAKNTDNFHTYLTKLHPEKKGQIVCLMLLSKLARYIYKLKHLDIAKLTPTEQARSISTSPDVFSFYNDFVRRFSTPEVNRLWDLFTSLDVKLQADTQQEVPGRPNQSPNYIYSKMPTDFDVADFVAGWSKNLMGSNI